MNMLTALLKKLPKASPHLAILFLLPYTSPSHKAYLPSSCNFTKRQACNGKNLGPTPPDLLSVNPSIPFHLTNTCSFLNPSPAIMLPFSFKPALATSLSTRKPPFPSAHTVTTANQTLSSMSSSHALNTQLFNTLSSVNLGCHPCPSPSCSLTRKPPLILSNF